jgi:hexosaminidase
VSADWGVNPYLLGVDEASYAFILHVLDEVLELFPSKFIHVGGDEAIKDQWQASPAVQAKLRALGLADERQLQTWFIERVGRYLATRHRRLIGWDEILEGGIPETASVMSWRGTQGAIDAARLNHDVVLSPAPTLYLDNLESRRGDEPAGRLAVQSLEDVYRFEPVPSQLTPQEARHVLGAQANLWTEYKTSARGAETAIFPRALALAEVSWSARDRREWTDFLQRLPDALGRLRRLGLSSSDTVFAVDVGLDINRVDALGSGVARVKLATQSKSGTLRYTLDGTVPTAGSRAYDGPFAADLGTTVTATAFDTEGRPLAAPRSRRFDEEALLSWSNDQLGACPNEDLGLRVPLHPDAPVTQEVYNINVFDSCWIVPNAPLTRVTHITVDAASLARNYALAHDADRVVTRPSRTSFGELQVLLDGCNGPSLADIPLPETNAGQRYVLSTHVSAPQGVHDLCLRFTGSKALPMPAIGSLHLTR